MSSKVPPLNALKAFEAAARHLSVKLAAEELCVTPGAVSQMLKTLESHLGVRLFERVARGIYLTDAGRDYLPSIRNAFRQIAEASRRVAGNRQWRADNSVTPFFASAWLVPRMKSFQDAYPDIDLQLVTSSALVASRAAALTSQFVTVLADIPAFEVTASSRSKWWLSQLLRSSNALDRLNALPILRAGHTCMMLSVRGGVCGFRPTVLTRFAHRADHLLTTPASC